MPSNLRPSVSRIRSRIFQKSDDDKDDETLNGSSQPERNASKGCNGHRSDGTQDNVAFIYGFLIHILNLLTQHLPEYSGNGHEDNQLDAHTPASKQPDPQSAGVSGTKVDHEADDSTVENLDHARALALVDRLRRSYGLPQRRRVDLSVLSQRYRHETTGESNVRRARVRAIISRVNALRMEIEHSRGFSTFEGTSN
ncbi:hypothetical protein RUND412_000963 [Rhizina undulata]